MTEYYQRQQRDSLLGGFALSAVTLAIVVVGANLNTPPDWLTVVLTIVGGLAAGLAFMCFMAAHEAAKELAKRRLKGRHHDAAEGLTPVEIMWQQTHALRDIQKQIARNRQVAESVVAATLIRVEALGPSPAGQETGDVLQQLFLSDVAAIVSDGNRALINGGGYDVIARVQQRADAYFQYVRNQHRLYA